MSTKRRAVTGQGEETLLSREAAGLARLSEASSRLWRTQDLRAGLEEMLAATIELLGADKGAVQLLDADAGVLRIVAQRGFEADFLDFFQEVAPGEHAACGRALRSGERIVIEDIEADAPFAPLRPMARAAGYRAVQSTPLLARDGTPLGVLSTHFREPHRPSEHELRLLDLYVRQAVDFIERHRVEAALRESEERHRQLFEHMSEGFFLGELLYDDAGRPCDYRHLAANPALEWVLGMPRERLVGKTRSEVASTPSPWLEVIGRVVQTGRPEILEDYSPVLDRHLRVAVYSPRRGHFACLIEDITSRKRAEEALLAAERARAALAENLGGEIAHRVKNNLAMISGLMQMQLLQESDAHTTEALRDAIGRIRTFATLHEQMYASRTEEVDLLVVLQRIGRTIGDLFPSWDKVAVEVLGDSFRCHARAATNLSVIANELITNALKHGGPGPDGQRTIRVSLQHVGEGITLSVWNSGAPVPEDLDPSQSQAMGLRLVQDMVDRYGGRFQLGPSKGGTRAEVAVPGEAIRKEAEHR